MSAIQEIICAFVTINCITSSAPFIKCIFLHSKQGEWSGVAYSRNYNTAMVIRLEIRCWSAIPDKQLEPILKHTQHYQVEKVDFTFLLKHIALYHQIN